MCRSQQKICSTSKHKLECSHQKPLLSNSLLILLDRDNRVRPFSQASIKVGEGEGEVELEATREIWNRWMARGAYRHHARMDLRDADD